MGANIATAPHPETARLIAEHRARNAPLQSRPMQLDDDMIAADYRSGLSLDAVGIKHGCSPQVIRKRLAAANEPIRSNRGGPKPGWKERQKAGVKSLRDEACMLADRGVSREEICAFLGLSRNTVKDYLDQGPTTPPVRTQKRRCLRCDKRFDSEGPGNRVCGSCKGTIEWNAGVAVHGFCGA